MANDRSNIAFKNLFRPKELTFLFGEKKRNLISLSLISFLAIIAVAHAVGSYKTLEVKMNNPYTKWLKVEVPSRSSSMAKSLVSYVENDSIKNKYGVDTIVNYCIENFDIINFERKTYNVKFRTVDYNESLLTSVLLEENIVHFNKDLNYKDQLCWVVLSEEVSSYLTKTVDGKFVIINPRDNYQLYVPILAVVKELPDVVEALMSSHFYSKLIGDWEDYSFIDISSKKKITGLVLDEINKQNFEEYVNAKDEVYSFNYTNTNLGENLSKVDIVYKDEFSIASEDSIYNLIQNKFSAFFAFTDYECYSSKLSFIDNPYYLSIMLDDLKNVRGLKKEMEQNFNLNISLDQVINKENFRIVSFITLLLTGLIVVLLLIATILFLNSVLSAYLTKIAPSLGTLKAFGLSNAVLMQSYIYVIVKFILLSFGLGILFALLYYAVFSLIFNEESYIHIFNFYVIVTLLILVIVALYVSIKIIKLKLAKSPGDLIYQR